MDKTSFRLKIRTICIGNQVLKLTIHIFNQNQIHVSAQDIDFSISAEEYIPCQFEGEEIKIGFKSTFLIEMLANVDASDIVIELADPSRAGIILPFENAENEDILMLLMPMLLND